MPAYSIPATTNAKQELALTAVVAADNARRAAEDPPKNPRTNAEYLEFVVNQALRSYRQEYEDQQSQLVKQALPNATDNQINQIKAILGLP